MSKLFRRKSSSQPESPSLSAAYDPFAGIRSSFSGFIGERIGKPGPAFPGTPESLVEGPSEEEKASLGFLKEFGARQPGEGFNLAKAEAARVLRQPFDPTSNPYYQAVKAESERNLEKIGDVIDRRAAMGRRFFSGARAQAHGEAARDTTIALNKLLGGLAETEQARRLQTIPLASALEEQEGGIPLRKTQAFQAYGALPRELGQATKDAAHREFLRTQIEYPLAIAQLAAGPGTQQPLFTTQTYPTPQPSILSRLLRLGALGLMS